MSDVRQQFIGTWNLISFQLENSDGEVFYPFGENVSGIHTWDDTGHCAVQVCSANRERFASDDILSASPEEAAPAFGTYAAYFGTYEVDEEQGIIAHNPTASLFPNWVGTPEKRSYQFSGNQLVLTMLPQVAGGRTVTGRLVWDRFTG